MLLISVNFSSQHSKSHLCPHVPVTVRTVCGSKSMQKGQSPANTVICALITDCSFWSQRSRRRQAAILAPCCCTIQQLQDPPPPAAVACRRSNGLVPSPQPCLPLSSFIFHFFSWEPDNKDYSILKQPQVWGELECGCMCPGKGSVNTWEDTSG